MLLVLAAQWKVFMRPIQTTVENAEILVKAIICLHNFLHQTNSAGYCRTGFVDSWDEKEEIKEGEWRILVAESRSRIFTNIPPIRGSRPTIKAVGVRKFKFIHKLNGRLSFLAMGPCKKQRSN